jgi:hypothetical protein
MPIFKRIDMPNQTEPKQRRARQKTVNSENVRSEVNRIFVTVEHEIKAGFFTDQEICELVTGAFGTELTGEIQKLVHHYAQSHEQEERTWPKATDCDRLEAALCELESVRILARQHFYCCRGCGEEALRNELEALNRAGAGVRGFVFYTAKQTDEAVIGQGLNLFHGNAVQGAPLSLGLDIVATLGRHGLSADWDCDADTCIHVPLDWKKRRLKVQSKPLTPEEQLARTATLLMKQVVLQLPVVP